MSLVNSKPTTSGNKHSLFPPSDSRRTSHHEDHDAATSSSNSAKKSKSNEDQQRAPSYCNSTAIYLMLPLECRVQILQHLARGDLEVMTLTCKQFHQDSFDDRIGVDFRIFQVRGNDTAALVRKLCEADRRGNGNFFAQKYHRLQILEPNDFANISVKDIKRAIQRERITGITSLDLSIPTTVPVSRLHVRVSLAKALGRLLPCLREIDLSNTRLKQATLVDIAKKCPLLEKLSWNRHRTCTFLSGQDLKACNNLKELIMDDSEFYAVDIAHLALMALPNEPTHVRRLAFLVALLTQLPTYSIFFHCKNNLERVSIRNARAYPHAGPKDPLLQAHLIKFVRTCPTLRWFRSDLSLENIAMLKVERPEVEFL